MNEPLTISVAEAAELLGVSTKTCYTMTHGADFPTVKIGRRTRISYSGLKAWVDKQAGKGVDT